MKKKHKCKNCRKGELTYDNSEEIRLGEGSTDIIVGTQTLESKNGKLGD